MLQVKHANEGVSYVSSSGVLEKHSKEISQDGMKFKVPCVIQVRLSVLLFLCVINGRLCRGRGLLLYLLLYLFSQQKRFLLLPHHQAVHLLGHALLPAATGFWVLKKWRDSLDSKAKFSITLKLFNHCLIVLFLI